MNNLANLFNEIQKNENRNAARVRKENLEGAYVFGEEQNNYETYFEEQNKLGRTREKDPFEQIGTLARSITSHLYSGDVKYISYIQGVYKELYAARMKKGFRGMTGFNMKGIICAILYLIVRKEERKQLSIDDLVKAANKVATIAEQKSSVKVTTRMIEKYIKVVSSLVDFSVPNNNNNQAELIESTLAHLRRLSISIQMTVKSRSEMIKMYNQLPNELKYDHNPSTVAKVVVYLYALIESNDPKFEKEMTTRLGITKYMTKNVVGKYKPYFSKK